MWQFLRDDAMGYAKVSADGSPRPTPPGFPLGACPVPDTGAGTTVARDALPLLVHDEIGGDQPL